MNFSAFIIKIIDQPEQSFFKEGIAVTEIRVKFTGNKITINSNNTFNISIWVKSSFDITKNKDYKINDYFIIEGYISLRDNHSNIKTDSRSKHIEVSVLKIYPLF